MKLSSKTYTVQEWTTVGAAWRKKGAPRTGLSRAAATRALQCKHEGRCQYPFDQCDDSFALMIEEE